MGQCSVFSWWNRLASRFGLLTTAPFGRCFFGIPYFFVAIRSSAQRRASPYFFSKIACGPLGPWRYYIQSFSRSPSTATLCSPPAARGNSPYPRLAVSRKD